MRLLIAAQVVDSTDPTLGFFTRWIEEFASRFESIEVVCLYEGEHDFPANVRVHSLGKEKLSKSSAPSGMADTLRFAIRFKNLVWQLRNEYDAVFVHQIQEFVLVAGPLWKLLGKRVYLWRNHYAGSFITDIAAALSTKVFCTSRHSYTAKYRKTVLMPVGVDLARFHPVEGQAPAPRSILFLARIAPSKRADLFIDALAKLRAEDVSFTASCYGTPLAEDESYYEGLRSKAVALGLQGLLEFHGGVPNDQAPAVFRAHEIFVNCSPSGMFDKTIFEAAASGDDVLVASKDFAVLAGAEFAFEEGKASSLADALAAHLSTPGGYPERVRHLKDVARQQSLATLADALFEEMALSRSRGLAG